MTLSTLTHYAPQMINLLAALMLLIAFGMLAQRRIISLINLFAAQGFVLVLNAACRHTPMVRVVPIATTTWVRVR